MQGAPTPRTGLVDFSCRLFDERAASLDPHELDLTAQRWFDQMAEHGPEHIVAIATGADELAASEHAVKGSRGRLTAFGGLAEGSDEALEALSRALMQQRIRGLVLVPGLCGYTLRDPRLTALFELASSLRAPVLVRCGLPPAALRDRPGSTLDMHAANPLELAPLADRFPLVPFVIQSFGAGFLREALMVGELCENVLLGTSAGGAWQRAMPPPFRLEDVFDSALGVFGTERLLFATGSGPAAPGWRSDLATLQREALGALELSAVDTALILAGNARRLLGL
jgi:predicted TIM-barrel fold metal-dependent hydrolase